MTHPYVALSPGQLTMAKGVATVWKEILPELEKRGVRVVTIGGEYEIVGAERVVAHAG
jgi:hypothetical protein